MCCFSPTDSFYVCISAYFQFGHPIYSAKAVRFRMGHQMYPMERGGDAANDPAAGFDSLEDQYVWTYTSPEFPMAQVKFYIPRLRFLLFYFILFYFFCTVCRNLTSIQFFIWDAILTH